MHTNVFFDFFPRLLGFLNKDAEKVLRVSCAQVLFVGRDFWSRPEMYHAIPWKIKSFHARPHSLRGWIIVDCWCQRTIYYCSIS